MTSPAPPPSRRSPQEPPASTSASPPARAPKSTISPPLRPPAPGPAPTQSRIPSPTTTQHLTQIDLYLDTTTLLPAALTFNIHPDNDMGLDLPVEIRFCDYRQVNGAQIPFHVQKSLNGSSLLDLQFQTVTLNSGLTPGAFSL